MALNNELAAAEEFLFDIGFQQHLLFRFLITDDKQHTYEEDVVLKEADSVGDSQLFETGRLLCYNIMHEVECPFTGQRLWIGWHRVAGSILIENADGSALLTVRPYVAVLEPADEDNELECDRVCTQFSERWVKGHRFFIDYAILLKLAFEVDDDHYRLFETGTTREMSV